MRESKTNQSNKKIIVFNFLFNLMCACVFLLSKNYCNNLVFNHSGELCISSSSLYLIYEKFMGGDEWCIFLTNYIFWQINYPRKIISICQSMKIMFSFNIYVFLMFCYLFFSSSFYFYWWRRLCYFLIFIDNRISLFYLIIVFSFFFFV